MISMIQLKQVLRNRRFCLIYDPSSAGLVYVLIQYSGGYAAEYYAGDCRVYRYHRKQSGNL